MVASGFTLGELAASVQGRVRGNPQRRVEAIRSLSAAGPGDLSFLTSAVPATTAVACLPAGGGAAGWKRRISSPSAQAGSGQISRSCPSSGSSRPTSSAPARLARASSR